MSIGNEEKKGAEGVIAVTRAIKLLEAFEAEDEYLSLADLSRRSEIHKTTVLRIARTLASHHYLVNREDGAWRLGPAAGWLGARYRSSFNVASEVEPVLVELTQISGESATFFVQEGDVRICLYISLTAWTDASIRLQRSPSASPHRSSRLTAVQESPPVVLRLRLSASP